MDEDIEMREHVEIDEHEFILNHVILPRHLPPKKQEYSKQLKILDLMVENIKQTSGLPPNTIQLFSQMKRVQIDTTDDSLKDTLSKEIKSLDSDDTFAMFVRHQNCTLIIHKKPQCVILATFHGDMKGEVYKHDSDLECHYPSNAIKVKNSRLLESEYFIDQLCILHGNSIPENYVSKWLMTVLADAESKTASSTDFPVITKKVRNELVGDSKNYFQRSRIYMSTKVLLQHNLTMEIGAELGTFLYKILMLKFLNRVCAPYTEPNRKAFNVELLSQMIAKMARRIEKLNSKRPQNAPHEVSEFLDDTIEISKRTIATIREKIDNQMKVIHESSEKRVIKPLKCLNFESDIRHENIPVLMNFLKDRISNVPQDADTFECEIKSYRRYFTDKWPAIESIDDIINKAESNNDFGSLECRLFWNDFENRVLYTDDLTRKSPEEMCQWALKYKKYSRKMYVDNQLLTSRMILVYLKMIKSLDQRLCLDPQYQLLEKHKSGINPAIIDSLLLPQRIDMVIASDIEQYLKKRNESALDPSLIGEKQVSNDSFSVKFAKKTNGIKTVRRQIQERDEQNVDNKRSEWMTRRQEVATLRELINSLPPCPTVYGRKVCSASLCEKCRKTQEIESIKIDVYERLLPDKEYEQWAIAFELKIPRPIACLRDLLYSFVNMFSGSPEKVNIKDWIQRPELCNFKSPAPSLKVSLGSTTQSNVKKIHVEQSFDKFIAPNPSNCIFHADQKLMPLSITNEAIKNTPLLTSFKTKDEYSVLQSTLNGTTHTENEVLARQSKCPENLSLSEFKSFGTLRADGHRLQLRKLYAMIESEAVSFEKESVMSLILQTLWECGVSGDTSTAIIRESHVDLLNQEFCSAMLERLTTYTAQQENNWMHPFKLLMVTVIVVRIYELNHAMNNQMVNQIVKLLNKIRATVHDWFNQIEKVIHGMKTPDEGCEQQLRLKLIYVAIVGCVTFFVHPKHKRFQSIVQNNDLNGQTASQQWLHFIITLKSNMQVYTRKEKQVSPNLRMFLRLIERIGIDLEQTIKDSITQNSNQIDDLIRKEWPKSNSGVFITVTFHSEFTELLTVRIIEGGVLHSVSVDIITGSFLVNGLPLSRLPLNFLDCDMYRWFFGDSVFEVQPDSQNSFSTSKKYNDCIYTFRKVKQEIIITEQNDNGVEKELIHYGKFKGDFPNLLIKNYSHWWNKQGNCIEFRKRACNQEHFSKETTIDYRLDLGTKRLTHVETGRSLLDIKSTSYKNLVEQLERLERSKHMHVLLEQKNIVVIELLRMKLKFRLNYSETVDPNHEFKLESNEFGGMYVSSTQNIGTLYGLEYGLVLESSEQNRKILLIPNGRVRPKYLAGQYSVDIETKNSERNPLFYQYQVDDSCQQLKSNDGSSESWFYLAHLHAVTSHGEIEPFLGMSGTERALQILQSAFAWSPSPYASEALEILRDIAKLSPIRKLSRISEREQVQNVTWPRNIPSRSAQDSFVFIVKKLFEDSQRLHGLYSKEQTQELTVKTELSLNERDYHRCLQLQPNMRVGDAFIEPKVLRTSMPEPISTAFSEKTQIISILYHTNQYKKPENPNFLKKFLTNAQKHRTLKGLQNDYIKTVTQLLYHEENSNLANIWINLYNVARKKKCSNEEFALVLSLLAHKDEELDPILALQAVARNPDKFRDIKPPTHTEYKISDGSYTDRKTNTVLQKHFKNKQSISDSVVNAIVSQLKSEILRIWPSPSVEFGNHSRFPQYDQMYDYTSANIAINKKLAVWYARHQLEKFIENVQIRLGSLDWVGSLNIPKYDAFVTLAPKHWPKFNIDVNEKICDNLCDRQFSELIKHAQDIWNMIRNDSANSANDWWTQIKRILQPVESPLVQTSLFPRAVPSLLLPKIIAAHTDVRLKAIIGAWGLAIANEQRQKRIEMYKNRSDQLPAMQRELENEPHTNWKPYERPEWLLFEIEQNLTIREIQIKVAEQMMNPPKQSGDDAKHSVMQLNMGEGKTSVIIPMLAAVLANGNQVCQITVLKALFTTNLKSLRQYLGGMLNQRMYTFPCRRDVAISKHIQQIRQVFEECQMKKGVILTQPDHRLSFQLKLYETIEKGDGTVTKQYLDTYRWINANVRNILDESDAILQPNYQLIYTMGKQSPPDGGELRWHTVQALLKRVPYHMKKIHNKWKLENEIIPTTAPVEFDDKYVENGHVYGAPNVRERADVFTPCRILDDTVFDELKSALADDFLEGKLDIVLSELDAQTKNQLKVILIERDIGEDLLRSIQQFSLREMNTIRILSGLLRFEVLKLALTKRWRVNYGVDPNGQRKMAIPFKAKDVPAEMSEFGHPDVAICLTQLSYYYSGLTDAELYQLFMTLESKGNARETYEGWLRSRTGEISKELIDPSISTYLGVNLDDPTQRDHILFPLLRHNMNAIDFWLANVVYPSEAKIFEQKLMCTTWDLCSEQLLHCVTGFSGTNDTKTILPLPIVQNDLAELENTNENMRQILLNNQDPRNQPYDSLPPNVSGMYIVKKMAEQKIPVLLDSGALMLELANKQVAVEWLKLMPESFDAAVYFDSNDILQTIDRNGIVTSFDCSVYRDNLSRCVVYLDDVHTRGTDLKFPLDWVACVTLSGEITRDKTVQSCMRMRRLGRNQTICFWASYEADIRLRKVCHLTNDDRISNEHVIDFISHNSRRFEMSNMVHWTTAALNYTKKMIGHKLYENASDPESWLKLYQLCEDKELVKLTDIYGDKQQALLTDIAYKKFSAIEFEYKNIREIKNFVRKMQDRVNDKLQEQAPDVEQFSRALNEEQQKELEQEQESDEKRQAERLFVIKPAKPVLNDKLRLIVSNGVTEADINEMKLNGSIYSFADSLSNTRFHQFCQKNPEAWAPHLFVSKDFKTVIEGKAKNHDEYLRQVMWILQVEHSTDRNILIVLSSNECNNLLPDIRISKKSTLLMYQPRLSQSHRNLFRDNRLWVTGQSTIGSIDIHDEAQIAMYAGSMYFETAAEQRAYCGFLGLIPKPYQNQELEKAFEDGEIKSKGFVPKRCRRSLDTIFNCVGWCQFNDSPVDFAVELIEARHQSLQKDSHVASILERGFIKLEDNERFGMVQSIKMEVDE